MENEGQETLEEPEQEEVTVIESHTTIRKEIQDMDDLVSDVAQGFF